MKTLKTLKTFLIGRRHSGSKLVGAVTEELKRHGAVQVVALSEQGVKQTSKLGQAVANRLGTQVQFDPRRDEFEIAPGKYVAAVIVHIKTSSGDVEAVG